MTPTAQSANPFDQSMVKMQFPAHLGGALAIAGFNLEADKDGCVTVPSRHVADLEAHGLTRYVEPAATGKKK